MRSFFINNAEMVQLTPKDPDQFIAISTHLLCLLLAAHHSGICNSISWLLWESTQKCIMGISGSKSSRFLLLFVCLLTYKNPQKSTYCAMYLFQSKAEGLCILCSRLLSLGVTDIRVVSTHYFSNSLTRLASKWSRLYLKSNCIRPFVEELLEAFSIFRDPYIICMWYICTNYILSVHISLLCFEWSDDISLTLLLL